MSQLVYHKSVSEFLKSSVGMLGFYFWIQFNIFAANVQKRECIVIWADPKARNLNKYTFCAWWSLVNFATCRKWLKEGYCQTYNLSNKRQKTSRVKLDSSTIIIPGSHLSNGITLTPVMMKQMNLNLICQSIIAFGTIGDVLWNRAQILPPGIKKHVRFWAVIDQKLLFLIRLGDDYSSQLTKVFSWLLI